MKSTGAIADMVEKIAFQSIGGVEGIYLPSQDNLKYGTLLTDYGVFLPRHRNKSEEHFQDLRVMTYPNLVSKQDYDL